MMCWKFCIGYSVEYIVWQAGPYSEGGQQSTLLEKCTSQPAHHTQVDNHAVVTAEKHNQHDPFSHEVAPGGVRGSCGCWGLLRGSWELDKGLRGLFVGK
ncbi:hypothetical protein O3P69_010905 [Scylla paramamosain]|uniref:Uncharacterized protein n=1 Tax=Scylla paramamosain TaxID=85552 RepID=A0AAW0TG56_SCYPA